MLSTHPIRTRFLSPADIATLVRRQGIAQTLEGMLEAIHADILRWQQFDKSARVGCHSPQGVIELMPIADGQWFSFKCVNGHPGNTQHGLPTVMALGLIASVATGAPEFLCELTLTTALRTATTSALAARALARPDARTMALIGNGAQAEFQALAFHHLLGISEIRLFDIDPGATDKLCANLRDAGMSLVRCSSVAEAVRAADIVTTVTADKTHATIITPAMVEPGMHLNAVGGDCPGKTELHAEVLRMAEVFVEFEPQTRIEGEIQQMPPDFVVTELWQVLQGRHAGRTDARQVTLFDSVGFALEDFSALRYVRDCALRLGLGCDLPLVPVLPDPRDLFGLIARAGPPPAGVPMPAAAAPRVAIPSAATAAPCVPAVGVAPLAIT